MFQLKISNDYQSIIEDIPYLKTKEDLPKEVIHWISEQSNNMIIYQYIEKKCYCAKCLTPLEDNFYCPKCQIKHETSCTHLENYDIEELYTFKELYLTDEIQDVYFHYFSFDKKYYFFDVINHQALLYILKETVYYDNPYITNVKKYSDIRINKVYWIKQDGIFDVVSQLFFSFDVCEYSIDLNFLEDDLSKEDDKKYNDLESMLTNDDVSYLYPKNLEKLKDTIYQYSHLWEYSDYLNKGNAIFLAQLTFFPVYCKSFAYLLKFGLYQLAFHSANQFKKKGKFVEIFGVEKRFLPFMQKLDISYSLLNALTLYPKENLETLRFIEQNPYIMEIFKKEFSLPLDKIKKYFDKENLTVDSLDLYHDYLEIARRLELDLLNQNILFPKNLQKQHNILYQQLELKKDPSLDNKIKRIADYAMVNVYEDDVYKIVPAKSLEELLDESKQMSNCVRLYAEKIANGECVIYFLRKKEDLFKSLVTIEVRGREITQARERFNQLPSEEVKKILKKWEKTLVPIKILPKKKPSF